LSPVERVEKGSSGCHPQCAIEAASGFWASSGIDVEHRDLRAQARELACDGLA
jgi:hypothetical protein